LEALGLSDTYSDLAATRSVLSQTIEHLRLDGLVDVEDPIAATLRPSVQRILDLANDELTAPMIEIAPLKPVDIPQLEAL
jgi:hypothetical protein